MKQRKIIFSHLIDSYTGSPNVLSQVIHICKSKGIPLAVYVGNSTTGGILNDNHKEEISGFGFIKSFKKLIQLCTFFISQAILFLKAFKYLNSNVLFYTNSTYPFGASLAAKIMHKPLYYHIHEYDLDSKLFGKLLKYIAIFLSDKLIFVSHSLANSFSCKESKKIVIHNSISSKLWEEAQSHTPLDSDHRPFRVLMLASLKKYKGIDQFFSLAKRLEVYKEISFLCILSCNNEEWLKYKKGIRLPKNLTVLTQQRETAPYYKEAHIVVNLSLPDKWVETFGLTILEGLSFGVPVIAPNCGGPKELITHGQDGFLISPYDLEEIQETILRLYKDKKEWKRISANAKCKSMTFSPSIFRKKIEEFIKNV